MPLATLKEVLAEASKRNAAIPAFNIDSIESAQALLQAAEEENYPVIFAVGQAAVRDKKMAHLADVTHRLAAKSSIPIVLHLDHGQSFAQVIQALHAGFSSVMIDGSALSLDENIAVTRKVVEAANAVGASVEAELGAILGAEDNIEHNSSKPYLVKVEDVKQFNDAVTVDALAIGIGNQHGFYKGLPNLDFERLAEVNAISSVPLVLHGGSGIPADMIRKAIRMGILKINVATEVRFAYAAGFVSQSESGNLYKMSNEGKRCIKELAVEKIRLFRG